MSCVPPVNSRVNAIKSQFENLSSESYFSDKCRDTNLAKNFKFERSATSIDLTRDTFKTHQKNWSKDDLIKLEYNEKNVNLHKELNIGKIDTKSSLRRSIVKRTPAFRVGEKLNKINTKNQILAESEIKINDNFKNIISKYTNDVKKLQKSELTDSIKAALRQPLPTGPPPQKPPRTFESLSKETDVSESNLKKKNIFLQNNFVIKENPNPKLYSEKRKQENILNSSNLLNCLRCDKESMGNYVRNDEICKGVNNSNVQEIQKRPEPIYMQPFQHLNMSEFKNQNNSTCVPLENTKTEEGKCGCIQTDKNDLHYLCTTIDNNQPITNTSDQMLSAKEDENVFSKNYDEIAILLNAAFERRGSDKESHDSDCSTNSGVSAAIKLSRTLTEKRKDYVRRVSVTPQTNINNYGTLHKPIKSNILRTFSIENDQNNELKKETSIDDTDIISVNDKIQKFNQLSSLSNETNPKSKTKKSDEQLNVFNKELELKPDKCLKTNTNLFQVCLLMGFNTSIKSAYIKYKYPLDESVPENIEHLIFPSNNLMNLGSEGQEYSLIFTDDNGCKIYGYCRRVLPEKSEMCLPLVYCLISVTKALGFYFKVLKEIESRHGQSEAQINLLLRQLYDSKIPDSGKILHVKIPIQLRNKKMFSSNHKMSAKRLSLECNPKWLTESATTAAFSDINLNDMNTKSTKRSSSGSKSLVEEFEERKLHPPFDLNLINRSLIIRDPKFDEIILRRPNDLRLENTELFELLNCLDINLLIDIFSCLLLERKVILQSNNISLLSKSIFALQSLIYPFQWQYSVVTILPYNLLEICQAPFPILVGIIDNLNIDIEDGIIVNLDTKKLLYSCEDENTIIPNTLRDSLCLSLKMIDLISQGKMLSSVLISEAFLRFFVELFREYKKPYFNKNELIQIHKVQSVKLFLEWFTETSMFGYFCNTYFLKNDDNEVKHDQFYDLFNARLMEKSENKSKTSKNIEIIIKNSKIINKKCRTFKDKLKNFLNN